jgi:hypothetical protein
VSAVWRWLADGVVSVHFGYLAYVVAGGFLAWRWPKTITLHLLATGWAVLVVVTHVPCPLTALQGTLREHAGQSTLGGSFVDTYVRGTFYPVGQQSLAQGVLGLVVLASWVGVLLRRHRSAPQLSLPAGRSG